MIHSIIDFILPPRCPSCAVKVMEKDSFCGSCWSQLSLIGAPQCHCCGRPFDMEIEEGTLCAACLESPPAFDRARSALLYEGKGRLLVLSLKNHRSFVGVTALAKLMKSSLGEDQDYDWVMPVPLHPFRLLMRRFNQSQLLAAPLAEMLGAKMDARSLVRTKHREKQGKLKRNKRRQNVRGVFDVTCVGKERVSGARVLLVDDVITTGSTVNEAARLLKDAGARHVSVITLARADRLIDR